MIWTISSKIFKINECNLRAEARVADGLILTPADFTKRVFNRFKCYVSIV